MIKRRSTFLTGLLISLVTVASLFYLGYRKCLTRDSLTYVERPNIVLITVDTLRADHLDLYGYDRITSSAISELSKRGILFEHAISQAPWTLPSLASIHTSKYPQEHGAIGVNTPVIDGLETIAETLKQKGYYNIAILSHYFCTEEFGFTKGFDIVDTSQVLGHSAITSRTLTKLALKNLKRVSDQPFFLWIHYFDPHHSYVNHQEFEFSSSYMGSIPKKIKYADLRRFDSSCCLKSSSRKDGSNVLERHKKHKQLTLDDFKYIQSLYDEEIAYNDFWIGKLVSGIKDRGLEDSTVYILTSDHGEYFLEKGKWGHGKDVYEELIHVPLVISGAINRNYIGTTVSQSVEISSIARTIMDLTKVENHGYGGENLIRLVHRKNKPEFVFSYGCYARGEDQRKTMVLHNGWKLIHNLDNNSYELYNLSVDRDEQNDLWESNGDEVMAKKKILKLKLNEFDSRKLQTSNTLEIPDQTEEQLKSLGYVN